MQRSTNVDVTQNNEIEKIKLEDIRLFIFGGGGANGLMYAGALWMLYKLLGDFKNIRYNAGVSIGAVAALAVTLGLSRKDMFERLASIDFTKFKDSNRPTPRGFYERLKNLALYQGIVIKGQVLKLLGDVLKRSDPENVTFQDLEDAGYKGLHVVAVRTVATKPQATTYKQTFSATRTPTALVYKAILASAGATPYFPGHKFQCNPEEFPYTYYDGAFKINVPWNIFDYEEFNPSSPLFEYIIPSTASDFENRRIAISKGIIVDRVHNPHSLVFAITHPIPEEPLPPLHSDQPILTIKALIDGLMTNDDGFSLNPRKNRALEFPRMVETTDFNISDEKQKEMILTGARVVAKDFGVSFTEKDEIELCNEIDEVKNRAKAETAKVKMAPEKSQWSSIWAKKEKASNESTQPSVAKSKYKASL